MSGFITVPLFMMAESILFEWMVMLARIMAATGLFWKCSGWQFMSLMCWNIQRACTWTSLVSFPRAILSVSRVVMVDTFNLWFLGVTLVCVCVNNWVNDVFVTHPVDSVCRLFLLRSEKRWLKSHFVVSLSIWCKFLRAFLTSHVPVCWSVRVRTFNWSCIGYSAKISGPASATATGTGECHTCKRVLLLAVVQHDINHSYKEVSSPK